MNFLTKHLSRVHIQHLKADPGGVLKEALRIVLAGLWNVDPGPGYNGQEIWDLDTTLRKQCGFGSACPIKKFSQVKNNKLLKSLS